MGKEAKTNAMRILDRNKLDYEVINYTCDEFVDGRGNDTGKRYYQDHRLCQRRMQPAGNEKRAAVNAEYADIVQ